MQNVNPPNQQKMPNAQRKVVVTTKDLPIHCPLPDSSLWNSHPRVYIPLESGHANAICPYCGTVYTLSGAE